MYQRKPRRFRRRSNDRRHSPRNNGDLHKRVGSNSFSNGQNRSNFRNGLSPEKLFEKYSLLSKEAMSSGDKILSENFLQHADHFMRIVKEKNKNVNENKFVAAEKPELENKSLSNDNQPNKDQNTDN